MLSRQDAVLLFASFFVASDFAAYEGWLGPYGQPGDVLHLLLLAMVGVFTVFIVAFTTEEKD